MFTERTKKGFILLIFFIIAHDQSVSNYSYLSTFTEPSHYLRMITMSKNNEIFIAGGDDNKVHVYLNIGGRFVNHDTLVDSFHDAIVADITGDGKWIMTIDESGVIFVYKFNVLTHKYEVYQ